MLTFYLIGYVLACITFVAVLAISIGEVPIADILVFSLISLVVGVLSWGLVAFGVVYIIFHLIKDK